MKDIKTAEEFRKSFIKVSKPNHMNMILESAYRIDEMLKAYAEYYHKAKIEAITDEEIELHSDNEFYDKQNVYRFKEGVKWFKNKLLNDL